MSLRYHKSTSSVKQEAVDWEVFDEELSRVAPCFSDPRFDSLKHVLTVLSSNNAEQEVAEVGAAAGRSPTPGVPARCRRRCLAPASHPAACSHPSLQLRDQRASIEELVDAVVEGYHSGFNKSIHNYSQILRLFTESKLQVGGAGGAGGVAGCLWLPWQVVLVQASRPLRSAALHCPAAVAGTAMPAAFCPIYPPPPPHHHHPHPPAAGVAAALP